MTKPSFIAYTGPSMNPLLVEPEMLEVQPYTTIPPVVGDVIVFNAPGGDHTVVHRIIAVTPGGLRTRGDHNRRPDVGLIQPAQVVGRVVAAQLGGERRIIHGGAAGMRQRQRLRRRRWLDWRLSNLLHAPYRALAQSGLVRRLAPARWQPRVVVFQETRLLMLGTRVVGRYDARRGLWHIRRPFRLLIDEARLK